MDSGGAKVGVLVLTEIFSTETLIFFKEKMKYFHIVGRDKIVRNNEHLTVCKVDIISKTYLVIKIPCLNHTPVIK